MEALYDQDGAVYAWLHEETGNIYDTDGQNVAFVSGDGVFNYDGAHVGWWLNGHIRDRSGCVALFTASASNLGVMKPMRQLAPLQPLRELSPLRPLRSMRPLRPMNAAGWSEEMPF
jgi:hypothetical protein